MSFHDELEINEDRSPVSWDEHSQIVRQSHMDGLTQGQEFAFKMIEQQYEKTKSEDLKKIMDKMKQEALEKQQIIVMRPTKEWISGLEDLCRLLPRYTRIVEIGCYAGESTAVLAKNLEFVIAIDPWCPPDGKSATEDVHNFTDKLDVAERVFDSRRRNYHNIMKLKGFDYEFLDVVPDGGVDAVYLDGNHYYEEVKKNILAWLPKVKRDGFFCGHDYYDVTPGVVKAVDEIFDHPDYVFDDSSWAIDLKKRSCTS